MALKTAIFVISLKSEEKKRLQFKKRAEDARVEWEFFDAKTVAGPDLEYDEEAAILSRGAPLKKGEIGCYASHYAVWRLLIDRGLDQAIVFEDDAVVDWQAVERVRDCDLSRHGIKFLKLFIYQPACAVSVRVNFIQSRLHLANLRGYSYGTVAYAISREGAEFFIDELREVRRPIDDALERSWDHGVPTLCLYPFPAHHEDSAGSSIGLERFDEYRIPPRLAGRRFLFRLWDKLLRIRQAITGYGLQRSLR